jgi:hypothetical protein
LSLYILSLYILSLDILVLAKNVAPTENESQISFGEKPWKLNCRIGYPINWSTSGK